MSMLVASGRNEQRLRTACASNSLLLKSPLLQWTVGRVQQGQILALLLADDLFLILSFSMESDLFRLEAFDLDR